MVIMVSTNYITYVNHSFSFYANLYLLFHFWANVFCSFYPLLSSTASSLFSIALFVLSPQFSYDMIFYTSTFVNLLSHYKNVVIEHHSKLFGSRWNGSPRVARSRQICLFLYVLLAIVTRFTCLKPIVVITVTSGGSSARYISFYLTYFFVLFCLSVLCFLQIKLSLRIDKTVYVF